MRILQWCEFYPPYRGGFETIVSQLAVGLQARGHEILVLTGAGEGLSEDELIDGIRIRRFPFQQTIASAVPLEMLRLMRQVRATKHAFAADLVHLHFLGPSCFFHLQTMDGDSTPTLVSIHSEFREQDAGPQTLLGELLRQADWVTGVSRAMLADVTALAPELSGRASVVYNGVDPGKQPAAPQASSPEIFCFGRHVPDKGLDTAIDAFALIKHHCPSARLIIGSDGPERANLETKAAALGLRDSVTFTGWVDEAALRRYIDRAHVVCVPSRWREGFGLVALEAALRARPVVATNMGGLPEVVCDGATGLLVPPNDHSAMAGAIVALLERPAWARELGREAQRQARARFSFGDMCANYQVLYDRLVYQR